MHVFLPKPSLVGAAPAPAVLGGGSVAVVVVLEVSVPSSAAVVVAVPACSPVDPPPALACAAGRGISWRKPRRWWRTELAAVALVAVVVAVAGVLAVIADLTLGTGARWSRT